MLPPTLRDREIVCVGFADWETDLWTNQHHLMHRLGAANTVLFVESLGLRRPQLSGRDARRVGRRIARSAGGIRLRDKVHVLSPLVIPAHANRASRRVNRALVRAAVTRAARRLGMSRPLLWGYVPQAQWLIEPLAPTQVVYHCVDDIAAQKGVDGPSFAAQERRFAARADLVLASAPSLAKRLGRVASRVMYAPNVADTELFAAALEPGPTDPAVAALPRPRIAFTGAIVSTKLDFELIEQLARRRPEWSFALVGPVGVGDPSTDPAPLRRLGNVHLLGQRGYRELPAVLRGCDAGLIPYRITRLTESVFPMKVHEYLAAGLPVVSTALPALAEVDEVASGTGAAQIEGLLAAALEHASPAHRRVRSARARASSWERRLEQIGSALAPDG